ncbi:MAG: hypothetical protein H8M99_04735 [Gloeobacteraceae cyanobacterium ES-bin-144]|nr:hypothetical protein [Verrucomicrobiales bacterium]
MTRRTLRWSLVVALLISAGFAAWSWLLPYEWNVDSAARGKVVGVLLTKDQSFCWLDVHLKMADGQNHDLTKPVRLVSNSGKQYEAADMVQGNDDGTAEVWFKFWLEFHELESPLKLRINDGSLVIKANQGIPTIGNSNIKHFVTSHW